MFGFGVGIFVDLAFAQTLGVSALIFLLVGYGAGRVRELRAPEAPVTPLALGAAATAFATCGYAVLEFLLGVDAPISVLLVRDIVVTVVLNSLIAVPVYALVRRWLVPALPDDPRRAGAVARVHDRRAEPALAPVIEPPARSGACRCRRC